MPNSYVDSRFPDCRDSHVGHFLHVDVQRCTYLLKVRGLDTCVYILLLERISLLLQFIFHNYNMLVCIMYICVFVLPSDYDMHLFLPCIIIII